jgi:hypothetical protein
MVWMTTWESDPHSGHRWSGSGRVYVLIAMTTMLPAIPGDIRALLNPACRVSPRH